MHWLGYLVSVHLYPVKSLGSIEPRSAVVERRGFAGDRRWMVVDEAGELISQRAFPVLSLCRATNTGSGISLRLPGDLALDVLFPARDAAPIRVHLWKDDFDLSDAGDVAAGWLSDFLDKPVRLAYQPNGVIRPVDSRYRVSTDDHVNLSDGYPFLLTTEESLADLNSRLRDPVGMNRFRPNLVVSGFPAFAEDNWHRIQIGALTFSVAKPCARCQVVNVNPDTADTSTEPLKTLATFRKDADGKVVFGQNLIPLSTGRIAVGDPVGVIEVSD